MIPRIPYIKIIQFSSVSPQSRVLRYINKNLKKYVSQLSFILFVLLSPSLVSPYYVGF